MLNRAACPVIVAILQLSSIAYVAYINRWQWGNLQMLYQIAHFYEWFLSHSHPLCDAHARPALVHFRFESKKKKTETHQHWPFLEWYELHFTKWTEIEKKKKQQGEILPKINADVYTIADAIEQLFNTGSLHRFGVCLLLRWERVRVRAHSYAQI